MIFPSDGTEAQQRDWAVTQLRESYVASGCQHGLLCTSKTCLNLATTRVFWPVLPGEEFPRYCTACALWAKQILETLGHTYRDEALPVPLAAGKTRLIEME